MSKYKVPFYILLALVIIAIGLLVYYKEVKAPTTQPATQNNLSTPPVTETSPPDNTQPETTPTTGTLAGTADTTTLHINKIIVYNSTGKVEVSSTNLNGDGSFSLTLAPGDYMIDYAASPDLYPHSPEKFSIVAGQTHEVDYSVE
ncbi:MAG TPA: hypothetical protein VFX17_01045 [Patescibacteria group bacterium]|nr:hypothetical protein [Patescibacteria group bacterium]